MAVTIKDVAQHAGVSPMTVSNVINNHPAVNAEIRARVKESMTTLGYRVNVAARNLRTGRTYTIGVSLAELDRPYFAQLSARIVEHATRHGLRVLVEQTRSRQSEIDALDQSRNRLYDGLILANVRLEQEDVGLLPTDYPVVILGERIFDAPVDHVAMPNVDGARAAVGHLAGRGCRRIAMIGAEAVEGGGETGVSALRQRGYLTALTDAGLPMPTELRVRINEFTLEEGRRAVLDLLDNHVEFDGVFCITDTVALGVLRGLADRRIAVPDAVRVIGFDDIEESAFSVPSLSTIRPDHDAIARTAVELLVGRIGAEGRDYQPHEITTRFQLIERESSA